MWHPAENPSGEFLAPGGFEARFQAAVPPLPEVLAGMPGPFTHVNSHLFGKEQTRLPRFLSLADAEGVFEESPGTEPRQARKVPRGSHQLQHLLFELLAAQVPVSLRQVWSLAFRRFPRRTAGSRMAKNSSGNKTGISLPA
jgi:hypothetical protein